MPADKSAMPNLGQAGGTLGSNTVGDRGAVGADAAAVPENTRDRGISGP